jgi:hypothetical protein
VYQNDVGLKSIDDSRVRRGDFKWLRKPHVGIGVLMKQRLWPPVHGQACGGIVQDPLDPAEKTGSLIDVQHAHISDASEECPDTDRGHDRR